jgi:hypothetical protein
MGGLYPVRMLAFNFREQLPKSGGRYIESRDSECRARRSVPLLRIPRKSVSALRFRSLYIGNPYLGDITSPDVESWCHGLARWR